MAQLGAAVAKRVLPSPVPTNHQLGSELLWDALLATNESDPGIGCGDGLLGLLGDRAPPLVITLIDRRKLLLDVGQQFRFSQLRSRLRDPLPGPDQLRQVIAVTAGHLLISFAHVFPP